MDLMDLIDVIEIVMIEFPSEADRVVDLYNDEEFDVCRDELKKLFKVGVYNEE